MRMLHFVRPNTNVDFVAKRHWAFAFSLALVVVAMIALSVRGLNFGIDFKGGILIEAQGPAAVDVISLRQQLSGLGLGEVELQGFGGPNDVLIRIERQEGGEKAQSDAIANVRSSLGNGYEYRRVEVVGPRVGNELLHAGIMATVLAILAIGLYVAVRFEWQFGVVALVATFHDLLTTLGLFSVFHLDFNLTAVAALMTLAGYSINDTVVVFDRIRENLRRQKATDLKKVINDSVNQMLSRTIMTAGTILLSLIPLVIFGGNTLLNFSVALTWGIVVGTYSSIYVAAAMLLYLKPLRRIEVVRPDTQAAQ